MYISIYTISCSNTDLKIICTQECRDTYNTPFMGNDGNQEEESFFN